MKRYRSVLILACLALALGGVYFRLSSTEGAEATGRLYTLASNEGIAVVELRNAYGYFTFSRQDGEWVVSAGGRSYRTNPNKMELLQAALTAPPVSRVLDEELPDYGLDSPQAAVTVVTDQGARHVFELGAETASRSGVYLRDGATGRVMVTTTAATAQLTGSLAAYRSKEVFTIDMDRVRSLDYYDQGELVLSAVCTGPTQWFLTHPFEAPARMIELNELVAKMRSWQVAGYPEGDDYGSMGLEGPGRWLEVTDGNGSTQRLEIGASDGSTGTYVRTGGEDEVVRLYTVDLDFSTLDPDALLFIAPLRTTVEEIDSITIETPVERLVFEARRQEDGSLRYACNGRELSAEGFTSVFFKYISLNADGRDPGQASGEAAAILTTAYADGSSARLALLPRDGETLYMLLDGRTEYYLAAQELEQLLYRVDAALGR